MHTLETVVEIHVLARQGKPIKAISRELNVARNTVRKHPREPVSPRYGPRPIQLSAYERYVVECIEQAKPDWIPATLLLREIRELGYEGGYSVLKVFVALGYRRQLVYALRHRRDRRTRY